MNKQEVLEELETTSTQFFHVATSTGVEANNKTLSTGVFAGLGIAKSVLTKLEEPQKVIAQLSEKWHEDIGPVLWWDFPVDEPPYCGTPLDDDFPKYKTHFTELHIPDEVEQEQKWKIINDQNYCLTSIEAGYGNSLHWAFDSTKKKPILFDNEETAMYTAYITGGKAEKV
ncbi:hypothetical protein [Enterococcus avium]|uniref:hypothetical protein n=1 Tax=Enterococcus avium TaxID=33945 RepID=UPI003790C6B2